MGVEMTTSARAVLALLIVAAAAATAPAASAEDAPASTSRVSVLAYHPYPDPQAAAGLGGDPFGVPADRGVPRDRMVDYYDAYWFPTARFDGVLVHSYDPDEPARTVDEFEREYAERMEARLGEDAPVVIELNGSVSADRGVARATFTPTANVTSDRVVLRLVVFEDHVHYDGGNGVTDHRFMVREVLPPMETRLRVGAPVVLERAFNVSDEWDPTRLGVVAFAQNEDPNALPWRAKEVLQSASHAFAQANATVQRERAVLLEMYTATWCASCIWGDGAMERIVETYGVDGHGVAGSEWAYFRPPAWGRVALAGAVAAALGVALWPRGRVGGGA